MKSNAILSSRLFRADTMPRSCKNFLAYKRAVICFCLLSTGREWREDSCAWGALRLHVSGTIKTHTQHQGFCIMSHTPSRSCTYGYTLQTGTLAAGIPTFSSLHLLPRTDNGESKTARWSLTWFEILKSVMQPILERVLPKKSFKINPTKDAASQLWCNFR